MITHDGTHDGPEPDGGSGARAREPLPDHAEPPPPARERRRELGVPDDAERARLSARFGPVLRTERGHLTQQQLGDRAKLHRVTISRLEEGRLRPTTASIWAIARALRSDLRSRVALDERRRAAAGSSLRDYGRRPHAARERMRLELRLQAGDGLPRARETRWGRRSSPSWRCGRADSRSGAGPTTPFHACGSAIWATAVLRRDYSGLGRGGWGSTACGRGA